MSRTITALFDTRGDADAARDQLLAAELDADNVQIQDQSSMVGSSPSASSYSTREAPGFWASVKNVFLPDEDRHTYEEGVLRGGYLLTADVAEDEIDMAVDLLDNANSVDIDERSASWKAQGWSAGAGAGTSAFFGSEPQKTGTDNIAIDDQPPVYGRREAERGSARTRSYVADATLAGFGNEAVGNVKQGFGSLTGDESLKREGQAQERHGEAQRGKKSGMDE